MNRLKDIREDHDLTQVEMAEIIGISQTLYSRYELGKHQLGIDKYIKLALFFNISLDYLCGITDIPRTLTGIDYFENRRIIIRNKKGRE